jgi:hypothetical protein
MRATKVITGWMVRVVVILALAFQVAPAAVAQNAKAKLAAARKAAAAKPSGGPQEGIKVHGHWVIEVRNPDGSLAHRREFENTLNPVGKSVLAALLSRNASPGTWSVAVFDGLCPVNAVGSTVCRLFDSATGFSGTANDFITLTTTLSLPGDAVILSGSFTAANSGNVTGVATGLGTCPATQAPGNCTLTDARVEFSGTGVTPPVPVQQGQIVQVKVTFSFS